MSDAVEVDRWTRRGLVRALLIGAFCTAAGAGVGTCITHEPEAPAGAKPPEAKVPPAGARELAVVAPLVVGAKLADFEVLEIRAIHAGTIAVVVRRGEARVRLDVARTGGEASAPATGGPYAVYYSATKGASNDEGAALAQALAALVEKNAAAIPDALEAFRPGAPEVAL